MPPKSTMILCDSIEESKLAIETNDFRWTNKKIIGFNLIKWYQHLDQQQKVSIIYNLNKNP